jgi:hypothetical protein
MINSSWRRSRRRPVVRIVAPPKERRSAGAGFREARNLVERGCDNPSSAAICSASDPGHRFVGREGSEFELASPA